MKQKKTTHSKLSTELAFSFQKKGREKNAKTIKTTCVSNQQNRWYFL